MGSGLKMLIETHLVLASGKLMIQKKKKNFIINWRLFRTARNSARSHYAECRSAQSRGIHQRLQVPAPNRRRSDLSSDLDDKRPKKFREWKKPGPGTKEENWKRTISRAGPWRSRGWRCCLMNRRSWVRFRQPVLWFFNIEKMVIGLYHWKWHT